MKKDLMINDLQDIAIIISMNKDMFKENFDKDIIELLKKLVKNIKGGKYE